MGKSLIITEKPSVARDFAKVLNVSGRNDGYIENNEYVISWCVGHLVGMVYPEEYDIKYKKWRLEELPFLPEEYKYDVIDSVRKQYDIVHSLLHREDIDTVYWAGDAGKEGQTIEENIRNYGGVAPHMKELRVWIDSQTDEELLRGIREAKDMTEYKNLGLSGIMRTIEDYAMGINFSRVMSIKYGNLLNKAANTKNYTAIAVGRVMTCVLGMVVIREREIRNFKETPFYRISGSFIEDGIKAEWKAVTGSKYEDSPLLYKENGFKKREDALNLIESLYGKKGVVDSIDSSINKKKAPLLFNLAELQAECSKRFKISPDETLNVAQSLYEKKLTTYPRTDARVLTTAVSKEIVKTIYKLENYSEVNDIVKNIKESKSYLNIAKTSYVDDSKVTDHYAIIPTGQLSEVGNLNSLEKAIYDLIVKRFLAIFYPPAEYKSIKLVIDVEGEKFFSSCKELVKEGYLSIYKKNKKDDEDREDNADNNEEENSKALLNIADTIKAGDVINNLGFRIKEGKTSPPKRYTSGSMVLAMENAGQLIEDEELRAQIKGSGIGTSATRAEIINKLIRISYINLNKKTQVLTPNNLGEMIYEVVNMTVPALLNPKMTASWEKGLDGIAKGSVDFHDYRAKLEAYIREETLKMIDEDLGNELKDKIAEFADPEGKHSIPKVKINCKCPKCGGDMVTTPFGFGCDNYNKDGTGCNFSIGQIAGRTMSEKEVVTLLTDKKTELLSGFTSKTNKKFNAILILKEDGDEPRIEFDFSDKEAYAIDDLICPACGSKMVKTPFGFGCVKYNQDDPSSCKFSIGTICGKTLSLDQVKKLLSDGRTDTIRGFKSKTGKKFDAILTFNKNEDGTFKIAFDFEGVEAKKVKDVVCPKCGGDIVVTNWGYGCSNYKKDDSSSCNFTIGKIAGVKLKEKDVKALLTDGETEMITGFKSRANKKFDAILRLEDGEVKFFFPDAVDPVESNIPCPICQYKLIRTKYYYECACGFKISHMVANNDLSEDIISELLNEGETKESINGFKSKNGSDFAAKLKYNKETGISFDFS